MAVSQSGWARRWTLWLGAMFAIAMACMRAQSATTPAGTPRSWVEAAATNELRIVDDDGSFPLRYRQHKIDAKGDTVREIVETRQGSVARLIERDGRPLTTAEDAAERDRLNAILATPADFIKHHKRDSSTRDYSMQLIRQMPEAMIYSFVAGQPQTAGATAPQVVLDFHPDPAYKPPTIIADLLTGLEGRMWIDAKSRRLIRAEARVVKPVNFGWGMLAQIHPGGTVEFEQANAGGDRWVYSHVDEHIVVRAMMVKTLPENNKMTSSDFRLMAAPVSVQEAIHLLLTMPVALR